MKTKTTRRQSKPQTIKVYASYLLAGMNVNQAVLYAYSQTFKDKTQQQIAEACGVNRKTVYFALRTAPAASGRYFELPVMLLQRMSASESILAVFLIHLNIISNKKICEAFQFSLATAKRVKAKLKAKNFLGVTARYKKEKVKHRRLANRYTVYPKVFGDAFIKCCKKIVFFAKNNWMQNVTGVGTLNRWLHNLAADQRDVHFEMLRRTSWANAQ
jgi:hypothetical protein